jgi:uncharacterized protein
MELAHRFTVPTSVEDTWAHFNDLASVAECFPGAQLTAVEEESFQGSVKVKLGPIALLYNGSGTFVERDEAAHRFVIDAKGKDKRGNGTAGAKVTLTLAPAGESTEVEVLTDLVITGKPAQFGRGVMQDVSDKLLGQFVACLETRLGGAQAPAEIPAATPVAAPAPEAGTEAVGATAAEDASPPGHVSVSRPARAAPPQDEALDLGTVVLPVLARAYWKPALGALVGLAVLVWVIRRLV